MLTVKYVPVAPTEGTYHHRRSETIEVLDGWWAVFVDGVQTNFDIDWKNAFGKYPEDYSVYSDGTSCTPVDGPYQELRPSDVGQVVVSRRFWGQSELEHGGPCGMTERLLFFSQRPFVVRTCHDDIHGHSWCYLATRVGPGGLTRMLPDMPMPEFVASRAGSNARPGKWCRLSELARLVGWDPRSVLSNHARDVNTAQILYDDVHVAFAGSAEEMSATHRVDVRRLSRDWLETADFENAWVRKHFALVVLYFHHIGWTQCMIEAERRSEEGRRRREEAFARASAT